MLPFWRASDSESRGRGRGRGGARSRRDKSRERRGHGRGRSAEPKGRRDRSRERRKERQRSSSRSTSRDSSQRSSRRSRERVRERDLRRTTKGVRLPRRAFKVAWRLLVKDRDDRVLPLQVLDARQVAHGSLQARLALRKEQEGVGAAPGAPRGWKNSTHHLVCNNLTYILDVAIQELGEDVVTELACFEYLARVVEAFLMVEKTSGWNNGAMHLLPLVEGSTIGSAAARAARKAARQEAELASAAAAAAKKDK
eukprot:jgi/Mesvir1/16398/Mv18136-RA.1